MIVASIYSNSLREGAQRLKPNYYLNDGKLRLENMRRAGHQMLELGEVTSSVYRSNIFKRKFVHDSESGTPYISGADVTKTFPTEGAKLISRKFTPNQEETTLKTGQILVTCAGCIGDVRLVEDDLAGIIGSQDIIRINCDEKQLKAGFLYAYLSSPTAYSYMQSMLYGSVVARIEPKHVRSVPVPLLPDDTMADIDRQVRRAGELRVEAAKLLREAEARLLELLAIEPARYQELISHTERDTAQVFAVNSREVGSLTLRARNYSRRLQGIVEELSRHNPSTFESVLERAPYYTGRFKRIPSRAANALELMSQGDIFSLIPQGLKISPKWVSQTNQALVKRGSILIPGVGTLGENEIFSRARFVWGYLENKVVAQHLLRIEPDQKKIDSGYLYAVLSNKLWFRILRSSVCGTSLLSYIIPMLNEMPIPRFSADDEKAIGAKVKAAYECLTTANELETTAIHTVETHIGQWQPS